MKVVINRCFGGFGLSDMAIEMIMKRKGLDCYRYEYKFKNDGEDYIRVDGFSSNLGLGNYYSTADLGKKVDKIPDENFWYYGRLDRTDEDMIAVIEEIGEEAASGKFSELSIVEIPDDVNWELDEYDGIETIHEVHRTWC